MNEKTRQLDHSSRQPRGASADSPHRHQPTHGPDVLEALGDLRRERLGEDLEHADSCYSMWASVLELALRDFIYLQEKKKKDSSDLSSHERSKLERIRQHDPEKFLEDQWFDEVCGYLGVSAAMLRDRITDEAPLRRRHHRPGARR